MGRRLQRRLSRPGPRARRRTGPEGPGSEIARRPQIPSLAQRDTRQRFSAYEIGVVLAQDGRCFGGPPAGAAVGERRPRKADLAERRVLYHVDQPEVPHLRRGVHLVQRPHPPRRYPRLVQSTYPLVHARGLERRGHRYLELFDPSYTVTVAGEAFIVRVEPDQRCEPPPEPLGADGDVDLPVGARVGSVRRYGRVSVAARLGDLSGYEPARSLEGMYAYDAPQKRGRHPLASAAPLPLHQGRGDAEGPEHAGEDVGDGYPDLRRGTAHGSGEAHQAPFTLHDLVETRPVAVRPALPEARDRERDQLRVQLLEFSLIQTQLLHHPGAEVLDEHVGPADHVLQLLQIFRGLEVQHHRLLVPVHREEVRGFPLYERWSPAAAVVALPGALDLHHLGAGVGQHHGGVGTSQRPGEVHDSYAGERASAHRESTSGILRGSTSRWTPDLRI